MAKPRHGYAAHARASTGALMEHAGARGEVLGTATHDKTVKIVAMVDHHPVLSVSTHEIDDNQAQFSSTRLDLPDMKTSECLSPSC